MDKIVGNNFGYIKEQTLKTNKAPTKIKSSKRLAELSLYNMKFDRAA